MRRNATSPPAEKTTPKQYPIKHKRAQGQIIQRGPNRFLVWVHSHTDASGRKKRYTKMWGTLREADADLARVVAQRNRGKGIVDTNETLRAYIERFLSEAHAPRVKSYVHGKVTRAFKAWVFPFIGYKRVRSITTADVQNLYATLRGRISPRTNAPISEATIQRVHVHLRMAFNWGVRTGELSRHPMENVTVRKPPRQKMVTFSEQQVRFFFQNWEEYQAEHPLRIPYGCVFHVAYETGMRPEEYLGLQFSDLHLDDDPPHIRVQRVAIRDIAKGGWWFDEPKTKGSVRNIPISRELTKRLRLQWLTVENYKRQRAEAWCENDLVFPNQKGEPIYQYLLTDLFREIVRLVGLDPKKYRLYTWRHSMATLAIANRVNVKAVSERLGHADISRTLETYTHVLPSMQLEARRGVAGAKARHGSANEVLSFAEDTAVKTGQSARNVQRKMCIVDRLSQDVKDAIRDTPLADSYADMKRLPDYTIEMQEEIVATVQAGKAKTVGDALNLIRKATILPRVFDADKVAKAKRAIKRASLNLSGLGKATIDSLTPDMKRDIRGSVASLRSACDAILSLIDLDLFAAGYIDLEEAA